LEGSVQKKTRRWGASSEVESGELDPAAASPECSGSSESESRKQQRRWFRDTGAASRPRVRASRTISIVVGSGPEPIDGAQSRHDRNGNENEPAGFVYDRGPRGIIVVVTHTGTEPAQRVPIPAVIEGPPPFSTLTERSQAESLMKP